MSGIIQSSDADAQNYYKESIQKNKKESTEENNRLKKSYDREIARIQKNHQEDVQRIKQQSDASVEGVKDSSQKSLEDARKVALSQIQELKNTIYNKDGKMGSEAQVMKDQLDQAQRDFDQQIYKSKKDEESNVQYYHKKLDHLKENYDKEFSDFQTEYTQKINESTDKPKIKYQEQIRDLTQKNLKDQNNIVQEHYRQNEDQKALFTEAQNAAQTENNKKIKAMEEHSEILQDKRAYAHSRELEKSVQNFRDSRDQENQNYRDNVKNFMDKSKHFYRGHAEGRTEAIEDYESEWRGKINNIQQSYEEQIHDLDRSISENEKRQSARVTDQLRDKDTKSTEMLANVLSSESTQRADLATAFEKTIQEKDVHFKKDKLNQDIRFQNTVDNIQNANQSALFKQAEANRESMSNQTKNFNEKETALQRDLNLRKTTDDASLVSPLAAEKIRRSVVDEYEKISQEKTRSYKENLDKTREEFADRNQDIQFKSSDDKNKLIREKNSNDQKIVSEFNRHVQDLSYLNQIQKREVEAFHNRSIEQQNQKFTRMNEEQKRHFMQVMDTMMANNEAERTKLKEQYEFDKSISVRKINQRFQEQISESQKELGNQKNHYEIELSKVKSDKEFELQKLRNENRVSLETMERQFSQRIEALQQSQIEREKTIQARYEKEMNNLRNSHDRLIQQKS